MMTDIDTFRGEWQDSVQLLASRGQDLAQLAPVEMQCHYCGYTPRAKVMSPPPKRCPKCGGGSWDEIVSPGTLAGAASQDRTRRRGRRGEDEHRASRRRSASMTSDDGVRFHVNCEAQQVYLALQHEDDSLGLFMMRPLDSDHWEQVLKLEPGQYRYRYYVDDGSHLISFRPAAGAVSSNRLDAELTVPERVNQPETAFRPAAIRPRFDLVRA